MCRYLLLMLTVVSSLIAEDLTITTTALPSGIVGASYSAQVAATGGVPPYSWFASLPAGLTINSSGQISGVPTSAFSGDVTISVWDSNMVEGSLVQNRANRTFALTIAPATSALTIMTAGLANATVGAPYSATVAATGGTPPYTWSATGLPAPLAIDASTGQITGTPTAAQPSPGASVTVTVQDSAGSAATVSRTYALTVNYAFVLTASTLPNGVVGVFYNPTPVTAGGGLPPYTWAATGLPAPLVIDPSSGQIHGSPTAPFSGNITITAHDSSTPQNSASKTLLLTINSGLTVTTTSLRAGFVGVAYTAPLAAAGGAPPYSWSATGLPAPLSINTSTGLISGTPTVTFSGNVTITAKDSSSPQGTTSVTLPLTVNPALTITSTTLPSGIVGASYSAQVAATGGVPPYSWFASLPAGLTINSSGQISGVPTSAFSGDVTISAWDSNMVDGSLLQNRANRTFALTIGAPSSGPDPAQDQVDAPFLIGYAANLQVGESYFNITNSGASGAPLLGPGFGGAVGNICVNVYAFSPDEQLISCCSCLVTPNGVVNLGVNRDLTAKTLTGVIPSSVVVKLVSTLAGAGGAGTSCTNSAAAVTTATLAPGMQAWGTRVHGAPAGAYAVTETPFLPATLSAGELSSIGGRCASILGNGSGFGICSSCRAGALGASKQ